MLMFFLCSTILDFQGNEETVAFDLISFTLIDATGWEIFSCIAQSCHSQRSRTVSFRGQLQPLSIHKLHVFVALGLMIAMDYQCTNVPFLKKIQSRSKSQVVRTTRPEGFWTSIGWYFFLLKAWLLGQAHDPYKTGCVAHELLHSS